MENWEKLTQAIVSCNHGKWMEMEWKMEEKLLL